MPPSCATFAAELSIEPTSDARSDEILQWAGQVRARGCADRAAVQAPLRINAQPREAAHRWAEGSSLRAAIDASGYRQQASAAMQASGDASALHLALARQLCNALTDARYVDAGVVTRGTQIWLVVAAPFEVPAASELPRITAALLDGINQARRAPRRCGERQFAPAPPLHLNARLNRAASMHAQDMLLYDYFEHRGRDGSTPATRVAASGYSYRVVGENIAFGEQNALQAVQGWLHSPSHCDNIMDARFSDTGFAVAASRQGAPRIYWVEEFAAPR